MAHAPDQVSLTEKLLPTRHDAIAPDGSLVRRLPDLTGGGMAHFELGAGEVSRPKRHRTVEEIWYVLQGMGRMWRRQEGLDPREIDLRPGVALTIPVGTSFQFRNTGREPLTAIGVTMPRWPGEDEAIDTDGPWTPSPPESRVGGGPRCESGTQLDRRDLRTVRPLSRHKVFRILPDDLLL